MTLALLRMTANSRFSQFLRSRTPTTSPLQRDPPHHAPDLGNAEPTLPPDRAEIPSDPHRIARSSGLSHPTSASSVSYPLDGSFLL